MINNIYAIKIQNLIVLILVSISLCFLGTGCNLTNTNGKGEEEASNQDFIYDNHELIAAYRGLSTHTVSENLHIVEFDEPMSLTESTDAIKNSELTGISHINYEVYDDSGVFLYSGSMYLNDSVDTDLLWIEKKLNEYLSGELERLQAALDDSINRLGEYSSSGNLSDEEIKIVSSLEECTVTTQKLMSYLNIESIRIVGFNALLMTSEEFLNVEHRGYSCRQLCDFSSQNDGTISDSDESACISCDNLFSSRSDTLCESEIRPNESYISIYANEYNERVFYWRGKWTNPSYTLGFLVTPDPAFEPDIKMLFVDGVGWAEKYPQTNYLYRGSTFQYAYIDSQALDGDDRAYTIGTVDPATDIAAKLNQWVSTTLICEPDQDGSTYKQGYMKMEIDTNDACTEGMPRWSWHFCVYTDCYKSIFSPMNIVDNTPRTDYF